MLELAVLVQLVLARQEDGRQLPAVRVLHAEGQVLCGLVGDLHEVADGVQRVDLRQVVAHLVVVIFVQHLHDLHRSRAKRLLVRVEEYEYQVDVVGQEEKDATDVEGVLHAAVDETGRVDKVNVREALFLRNGHDGAEILDQSLPELLDSSQLRKIAQRGLSLQRRSLLHAARHQREASALHSRSRR